MVYRRLHTACGFVHWLKNNVNSTTGAPTKSVLISENHNIFVNLALEDWLYENCNFLNHQILLLWRNTQAVVIGRHQNPWLEVNSRQKDGSVLTVVRRNSGGGAVYHDFENLNLSFLTSRKEYCRKYNLQTIIKAVEKEWNIICSINGREDIILDSRKISGTASKLSAINAYHHCTLLVDADKTAMSTALHAEKKNIITNSTKSKPSPVMNLRERNSSVNVDRLMTIIGLEFLSAPFHSKTDPVVSNGFHFIAPEEKFFPGIIDKVNLLRSWEWIYGRTPKFKRKIPIAVDSIQNISLKTSDVIDIKIQTDGGIIEKIDVIVPTSFLAFVTCESLREITEPFSQIRYSDDDVESLKRNIVKYFSNKFKDQRLLSIL